MKEVALALLLATLPGLDSAQPTIPSFVETQEA